MNDIRVVLEGNDELEKRLGAVGSLVRDILEKAVMDGAEVFREAAQQQAPGPGIEAEVVKTGRGMAEAAIGPARQQWYYRFLETGAQPHEIRARGPLLTFEGEAGLVRARQVQHTGMAARPFLRPAFDGKQDEAQEAVGGAFWQAILQATEGD